MSATGSALQPTAVEIKPEEIMHVLFVEHDTDYQQRIVKDLQNLGCRVDAVSTPFEAVEKLASGKYQMIIVDIKFPHPAIWGDQFIISNHPLMHDAQLVALTGQRHSIRFSKEFEELGVCIIDKGEEDVPLQEISQQVYERAKEGVLSRINEAKAGLSKGANHSQYPLAVSYLSTLQEELLNELEQIEDKDTQTFQYKGKRFSVAELIEQVRQNTDIGAELIRMMRNLIKWREARVQKPHEQDKNPRQQT